MKTLARSIVLFVITWEARLVLKKYRPFVVAVTGNVGKTSTKDAIRSILEGKGSVRASEKSLNSEFGVPLTILGCESGWGSFRAWIGIIAEGFRLIVLPTEYPKTLVLEVGADHPGDIQRVARWIRPNVALITGIPDVPVHVEYFESNEDLAREKEALIAAVPSDGSIVLNSDDALVARMMPRYRSAVTYGRSADAMFSSSHEEVVYEDGRPVGMRFRVNNAGSSVPVLIMGAVGMAQIYPILAGCAVGSVSGIDIVSAAQALASHHAPKGRMALVPGAHGSTIIDDTYNASPAAMASALRSLHMITTPGKKIAVLGDMLELGKYSADAHRSAGALAAQSCDVLIVCGKETNLLATAAADSGMPPEKIHHASDSQAAGALVFSMLSQHDVILVKGSQSMRMERAVKEIMADPSRAGDFLVRQDPEWLKRSV